MSSQIPPPVVESYGVSTPAGAELLTMGGSGAIFTYPDKPNIVAKLPYRKQSLIENIEIEKRIYRRLGSHPNVILCVNIDDDAIYLERAKYGCIRQYYLDGGTATRRERISWSQDLANAVQYIHDKGVRHGDLGCRNILLDSDRNIQLCDFAGSGIDDTPCTVCPQDGFAHPDYQQWGTVRGDIHALGSSIFELMTFTCPHWEEEAKLEGMASRLIREGKYPDVSKVGLGEVIAKCWSGEYTSAKEVAESISKELETLRDDKIQTQP
ncbi:kinase-like domain-containing protein [Hypoxylon argillaceum]|nr:kinase-like domain-containing protein [Hypoxylon argillaceum]KAI1150897.1 kinase-like domain-containing protein [Nemania diffusa]